MSKARDSLICAQVDDKEQVTRWEAYWDNENEDMLAALGKVSALMKK